MTHLSVRACAAASYFRERAEQAKVPRGNLEITGRRQSRDNQIRWMSHVGQNRKSSIRAHVFRCSSKNGH